MLQHSCFCNKPQLKSIVHIDFIFCYQTQEKNNPGDTANKDCWRWKFKVQLERIVFIPVEWNWKASRFCPVCLWQKKLSLGHNFWTIRDWDFKGPRSSLCTQVPYLAVKKWNRSIITESYIFSSPGRMSGELLSYPRRRRRRRRARAQKL